MEAPEQVRRAIALLWGALLISAVDSTFGLAQLGDEDRSFQLWMAGIVAVIFAVDALLIFFASRRRNWARVLLLVLTIVGLSLYMVWPPEFTEEPWSWTGTMAATVLEIWALYMLFSGTGARWYARKAIA